MSGLSVASGKLLLYYALITGNLSLCRGVTIRCVGCINGNGFTVIGWFTVAIFIGMIDI